MPSSGKTIDYYVFSSQSTLECLVILDACSKLFDKSSDLSIGHLRHHTLSITTRLMILQKIGFDQEDAKKILENDNSMPYTDPKCPYTSPLYFPTMQSRLNLLTKNGDAGKLGLFNPGQICHVMHRWDESLKLISKAELEGMPARLEVEGQTGNVRLCSKATVFSSTMAIKFLNDYFECSNFIHKELPGKYSQQHQ
jgi:hypothetical protein